MSIEQIKKEIKEKENQLVILKLRLLKKELKIFFNREYQEDEVGQNRYGDFATDKDDVLFGEIQLMREIIKTWEDGLKNN